MIDICVLIIKHFRLKLPQHVTDSRLLTLRSKSQRSNPSPYSWACVCMRIRLHISLVWIVFREYVFRFMNAI